MTMNLTEAIKAVAPHVSKDKILPTLTNIRIQDGHLYATDRYTMADVDLNGLTTRNPAGETVPILDPELNTYLTPEDVKGTVVSLTADGMTFANGSTKPLNNLDELGNYPDIRRLLTNHDEATPEPQQSIIMASVHLAKFQARFFPKSNAGLTFTFGESNLKPVLVTHSDFPQFRALIVPMKPVK